MKCKCGDGKVYCFGIGVVDAVTVIIKDVVAITLECSKNNEVEEIEVNHRLVIVMNNGGKKVILVYA